MMAGLEVKVAFGSVWKETLTELSGGQRSLLALSLILSLLLFKPGEQGKEAFFLFLVYMVVWLVCMIELVCVVYVLLRVLRCCM